MSVWLRVSMTLCLQKVKITRRSSQLCSDCCPPRDHRNGLAAPRESKARCRVGPLGPVVRGLRAASGWPASRMRGDRSAGETLPLCWGNGPRTHWNLFAYCVLGRTLKLFSHGCYVVGSKLCILSKHSNPKSKAS